MKVTHLTTLLAGMVATAGALSMAVPGCAGDDKACAVGAIECLDDRLARVCAPTGTERTPQWIPFECEPGTACQAGSGEPGGAAEAGTASPGITACVGTCEDGASECVNNEISRFCLNGTSWQLDSCAVGEACDPADGRCKVATDGGGVIACTPGAKQCAAEDVEKVCDADGAMWIPVACGLHERCTNTECEPSPEATCDILGSGVCLDAHTAVRCLDFVGGYEEVPCEGDTYCAGGRCIGAVCAVGSTCVAVNQVRTCVDGVNQTDRQCDQGQVCVQHGDTAECEMPECTVGTTVCGNAEDLTVDPLKAYSRCVANTNSGLPEWQVTSCEGLLTCDPTALTTTNPCRQDCTPGSQACVSDGMVGVYGGMRTCNDDGTWGDVVSCNPSPGEAARICANLPYQEAGTVNKVACAQPVCADVWNNLVPVSTTQGVPLLQGACEGAQILVCDPLTGDLATTAVGCPEGICQIDGTVQADGLRRGSCRDVATCEAGESICVMAGAEPTSFYRTCESGVFSSDLTRCADDERCYDVLSADGTRTTACGGECAPGWTRCASDGVQTCDANGTYGPSVGCSVGHCEDVGNNEAKCVLDCIPNEIGCAGSVVTASDGLHTGTTQSMTCKTDGTWPDPLFESDLFTACNVAAGDTCRVSNRGEGLGCIQCIGPDVLGGNTQGVIDTRCDPGAPNNLQVCATGNTWGPSTACAAGMACQGAQQICGNCYNESSSYVQCSEAALNTIPETCGGCYIGPSTWVATCAQANLPPLVTDAGSTPRTCGDFALGPAGPWGSTPDCCSGTDYYGSAIRSGIVATCANEGYGNPSPWGGVADCCSNAQTTTFASALAFCAPL